MKITDAWKMVKSKTAALANIKERAREEAAHVIQIAEVSGTAGALAIIDGYRGKTLEVGGVDGALLIGGAMHVFGFVAGGSEATHIHNIADGALAKAAVRYGKAMGEKMAEKSTDSAHGVEDDDAPRRLHAPARMGGYGAAFQRDLSRAG